MAKLLAHYDRISLYDSLEGPYFEFDSDLKSVKGPLQVKLKTSSRHKIGLQDDLLKKAIGHKKGKALKVLDLTAGLLRDAKHLAQLGCKVTAIEENKILVLALKTQMENENDQSIELIETDAHQYLQALAPKSYPDVIYYDPMFGDPDRKSGAGKESILLQLLCAPQDSEKEYGILKLARQKVRSRVVVKRPRGAGHIGELQPDFIYKGKAVRFDVYIPKI